MKRYGFFLACLVLGVISCSVMPRSLPAQIALGTASVRYKYDMSYKEDTASNNYKNDLIYLDVGRDASLCYSFYTYYRDSRRQALLNEGRRAMEVVAQTSGFRSGVRYIMAKQYKTRTLLASDVLIGSYMYTEAIPAIDWQITQDTATLLSYPCRKATAQFRGRNWIAWFTTEIPLPEGPWQFGGLPGLILHLEDSQKHYIMVCTGIEQLAPPVAMQFQTMESDGVAYKKVSREQLAKLKRMMYASLDEYMHAYHGMIVTQERINSPIPPRPYNPIELE